MPTILDVLNNFKSLNIRTELPKIIQAGDDALITANQNQLYRGKKSDGSDVGYYGSLTYAIDKEKRNSQPGFGKVDLYDTGDFYNGFFVEVKSDSYLIYSKDDKVGALVEKYTDDIFGLDSKNKDTFVNEVVYPGIKNYIEAKTGLVLR